MPRLVTFGCSFTQGVIRTPEFNGLVDMPWGKRVADNLLWDFLNLSRTASGNVEIAKAVKDHTRLLSHTSQDVFVIAWSGLVRPFNWDTRTQTFRSPPNDYTLSFNSPDVNIPPEAYLFFSEMMIRATAQMLAEQDIKYLMINAFHSPARYPFTESIDLNNIGWIEPEYQSNTLWDIITENWLQDSDAMELSELNPLQAKDSESKYIASCGHPSPQGHILIADTLTPYIKKLI